MRLINVRLEQLVLSESCRADCALVAEMRWFQRLLVILGDVVEELPLVDFSANGAAARVLALVGQILHGRSDETVRAEQMALEALIGEEPELALLAVEWGTAVDHLRMNLDLEGKETFSHKSELNGCSLSYLVNPKHVISELLQILYVAVANLAYNESAFASRGHG